MHRRGNIFFLCFSFCIFCTRGKEPNVTNMIPISRHGLNKGNAIYLYVSEKRCCACDVVYHFLDNQLKQVKSSSLAIQTHAKSFHHNVFVSKHRLYSHLYFYIGFYSWNIVVFKKKESTLWNDWCCGKWRMILLEFIQCLLSMYLKEKVIKKKMHVTGLSFLFPLSSVSSGSLCVPTL